jgi:putative acetyltransferase
MLIRLAARADEPEIQRVIHAVYEEYGWPWYPDGYHLDLYNLQTHYFDVGNLFWVAEYEGEIVGTVALDLYDPIEGENGLIELEGVLRIAGSDCSLERLYVHPSARGLGIGYALWMQTASSAKEKGKRRMEIWSDKLLLDAHKLYERKGATREGERLCHDPQQSPEWGMALNL